MDYLFRGLAKDKKVRVLGIDAKDTVNHICDAHQTLPITTVALSRFLMAGALIGSLEKGGNGITMQIRSDGAAGAFFVQATPRGSIRGYVSNPQGELNLSEDELSLESIVGHNGILSVTKVNEEGQDFTSNVILSSSNIIDDIAYYFFTSEQVPTIVNLQVDLDDNGAIKDAKGYLIQLMTGYNDEDVQFLENLKLTKIDQLEKNILSLFPDFEKLETIQIKDVCDCNRDRFLNNLATLPISDLEDLAQEDIEVVCQFCAKKYIFTPQDLHTIIESKKKLMNRK